MLNCWRRAAVGMALLAVLAGTTACSNARTRKVDHRSAVDLARASSGPSGVTVASPIQTVASVPFARTLAVVRSECQATANAVGYVIPCPTVLPVGMTATAPEGQCRFAIIAPANTRLCPPPDHRLRGWFFGTSGVNSPGSGDASFQHLVLWGAPRVITNSARAVDGPAVYPQRVLPRGKIMVGRILMRWYLVPLDNPSAFRGHLVLLWTASGHTYVYGFHVVDGMPMARALDLELVRHLEIIKPHDGG